MSIVLSIISGITAVVGMIISVFSIRHNRFLAVDEFLTKIEDNNFIEAKKYMYNNDVYDIENEYAAIIVNFFIIGAYLQKNTTSHCGYSMVRPEKVLADCLKRQKNIFILDVKFAMTQHTGNILNG